MARTSLRDVAKQAVEDSTNLPDRLPAITEPRCNVCKSEFRPVIDRMIVGPYSYATIARQFMGKDDNLQGKFDAVRKSIERHAKNHVNVRSQAVREIIERRAIEQGLLVDQEATNLATIEGMLELYIQRGYELLGEEGATVRHQDILQAAQQLEEMRRNSVGEQIDVMKRQVQAISQAVREIVPEHLQPLLVDRATKIFQGDIIDVKVKYAAEPMAEQQKELVA